MCDKEILQSYVAQVGTELEVWVIVCKVSSASEPIPATSNVDDREFSQPPPSKKPHVGRCLIGTHGILIYGSNRMMIQGARCHWKKNL